MKFKHMRLVYYCFLGVLFSFLMSCSCNHGDNKDELHVRVHNTYHYNLTVAADLSNRITNIYPKPISDTQIIDTIIEYFGLMPKLQQGANQQDAIRYSFVNDGLLNSPELRPYIASFNKVDLGIFKKQTERMNYLRTSFVTDLMQMKNGVTVSYIVAQKMQSGSDIWSYLNRLDTEICPDTIINRTDHIIDGVKQIDKRENILVLITDGYLESTDQSSEYSLSASKIVAIRDAFKKSGERSITDFINKCDDFDLKLLDNLLLNRLNIVVLELYDRSLTKAGTATVHPTDLEIIEAMWAKWLTASKVKSFKLYPTAKSVKEAIKHLRVVLK